MGYTSVLGFKKVIENGLSKGFIENINVTTWIINTINENIPIEKICYIFPYVKLTEELISVLINKSFRCLSKLRPDIVYFVYKKTSKKLEYCSDNIIYEILKRNEEEMINRLFKDFNSKYKQKQLANVIEKYLSMKLLVWIKEHI